MVSERETYEMILEDYGEYIEEKFGSVYHYKHGELHRDNDLPAIVCADGAKEWHQNDELHRDNDLPAIVFADGAKEWYQNGEFIK